MKRDRVAELEARTQRLEARVAALADTVEAFVGEPGASSEEEAWLESHPSVFQDLPGRFVAVELATGLVVASEADQAGFRAEVSAYLASHPTGRIFTFSTHGESL
jgi:hypothetical protein